MSIYKSSYRHEVDKSHNIPFRDVYLYPLLFKLMQFIHFNKLNWKNELVGQIIQKQKYYFF